MKNIGSTEMLTNVRNFVQAELGLQNITDIRDEIVIKMLILLFSHRHNKGDLFITELEDQKMDLDFSIQRDIMYKYSKISHDNFFKSPIDMYFLIKLADSDDCISFIEKEAVESEIEGKGTRVKNEITNLKTQAIHQLNKMRDENS